MTVYQVSGATVTMSGDGTTKVDEIVTGDVINPITGASGPVFVKLTNSSTTDTATFGWAPSASVPEYEFTGLTGTASALGQNQEFDVSATYNDYAVTLVSAGDSFVASETITIAGTSLGGATPANDLVITVVTASPTGVVASLDDASLVGGTGYSDATDVATTASGAGTGLTVDIITDAGAVTAVAINQPGEGYIVGEIITITGGGADATIEVLTVSGGAIESFSFAGTAVWPQDAMPSETVVSPLTSAFVQVNGAPADTIFTGTCDSGDMYITPVNVVL